MVDGGYSGTPFADFVKTIYSTEVEVLVGWKKTGDYRKTVLAFISILHRRY